MRKTRELNVRLIRLNISKEHLLDWFYYVNYDELRIWFNSSGNSFDMKFEIKLGNIHTCSFSLRTVKLFRTVKLTKFNASFLS